jgi:hypothetical protein
MALPLVKEFLEKDSQPAQVKLNQPVVIYQGAKIQLYQKKQRML